MVGAAVGVGVVVRTIPEQGQPSVYFILNYNLRVGVVVGVGVGGTGTVIPRAIVVALDSCQ